MIVINRYISSKTLTCFDFILILIIINHFSVLIMIVLI